jgi:hypothetical protein
MRRFLAATSLALALAVPALAFAQTRPLSESAFNAAVDASHGNPDIAGTLEWQALVAQANADRLQRAEPAAPAYAAIPGASATDAAQSSGAGQVATSTTFGAAAALANQTCADGTDIAGGPWHPGEYCMPGGR